MAIVPYLAMTAAEIRSCSLFPEKIAWMACHFSPYGRGLSNLPLALPPNSVLMVDDITPIRGHDPELISAQLQECVEELDCIGILLDFQRPDCRETAALAKHLAEALPCPTAVPACYAGDLSCPVFLPPLPPSQPLEDYLRPWKGRDIWLELGLTGEILTLTETGCTVTPLPFPDTDGVGFSEERLHCHYTMETNEKSARFTLWRTKDDLDILLEEAASFGVTAAVGLFQELQERIR